MSANADAQFQGAILDLDEFLETTGELTTGERRTIVDQALTLIDKAYVHLPLKRAMHAVDPVQSLKLLKRQVGQLTERQFHDAMITIFKDLRDLHTNYILPAPYNAHTAFLPFMMKEYYDADGGRHYVVSRMLLGMQHPTFGPGVEVTHWSGVPIDRAVAINADREAGSNEAARHVRGLDAMTVRPMAMSLPPDAEWVEVGYRHDGNDLEIRLPWRVFRPDPTGGSTGTDTGDASVSAVGLDLNMELTNQARKALFVEGAAKRSAKAADLRSKGAAAPSETDTFLAQNSFFPDTFQFQTFDDAGGPVGYLRIRTFGDPQPPQFIDEVIRIIGLLPQDGLIIDVRGNGGGIIMNGERMLQLFSNKQVEAERLHFINNDLTLAIAKSTAWGGFANRWERSIDLSVSTGAVYSQGFPIEPPEMTNAIGRRYEGPVVVITDGRCYSTTDIFAAGFQDNKLGKILGVDENTGAGGANVFTHEVLRFVLRAPDSPFEPLPNGADMRVAIRRTTRVGDNAGLPLEDLGVQPDQLHRLTENDVTNGNPDLIAAAIALLRA